MGRYKKERRQDFYIYLSPLIFNAITYVVAMVTVVVKYVYVAMHTTTR